MIPRIELPKPIQPLHLYRHLLREASYLPGICRPSVDHAIRARFETVQGKVERLERKLPFRTGTAAPTPDERLEKAFNDGLRQLRALRAVNLGDDKRMSRLFKHVFGRLGKRRSQLLSDLLREPAPANSAELQSRLKIVTERAAGSPPLDEKGRPMKPVIHDQWDLRRIEAYLASQLQQQNNAQPAAFDKTSEISHPNAKRYVAGLPTQTIWEKPMPLTRIRLREEAFWKVALRRLAPPVSRSEWDRLAAAARGQLSEEMLRFLPRRTIAGSAPGDDPAKPSTWDWTANASKPVYVVEYPASWRQWRLTAKHDEGPYAHGRGGRHTFSRRRLLREYGNIFQTTSYVEEGSNPAVHWGPNPGYTIPDASPAQSRVFQNIDAETQALVNKGRKTRSRKKT